MSEVNKNKNRKIKCLENHCQNHCQILFIIIHVIKTHVNNMNYIIKLKKLINYNKIKNV